MIAGPRNDAKPWIRKRWLALILLALIGCNNPNWESGDRVLVAKCLYETGLKAPDRFDVVVFKFPGNSKFPRGGFQRGGPVKNHTPVNYIKRLLGLPGEVIALFFGQLFRMTPPADMEIPGSLANQVRPVDLWEIHNQPGDKFASAVKDWMAEGKLEIVRKPPEVMLAMRRIVYDNNHHAEDLKLFASRWQPRPGSVWKMAPDRTTFSVKADDKAVGPDEIDWLTYQHLIRPVGPIVGKAQLKPHLITDFMGYNAVNGAAGLPASGNWTGDLMLELQVEVSKSQGEFWMELSKGIHRFQAKFDLATGACTLYQIHLDDKRVEIGAAQTRLSSPGSYMVRLANFDSRLTLWVNRDLPFGEGVAYTPAELPAKDEKITFKDLQDRVGPVEKNDLKRPASLGIKGAEVKVSDVRLWRDTYYTNQTMHAMDIGTDVVADPALWGQFKELTPTGFYVYPGHYLCLGDNSTASSDGREWGLVPERLMLGRALVVYFPLHRAGLIR